MTTLTLGQAATQANINLEPIWDHDTIMEIRTGLFAQGDLLCIPLHIATPTSGTPIPAEGIAVIEGNHDHRIIAPVGTATWIAGAGKSSLSIGVLTCTQPVYLIHAEHGGHGLAAGVWEMRGQREDSREGVRRVVD
jgi:hypothetical protein